LTPDETAQFTEIMQKAQELKEREELIRIKCDEIDKLAK